MTQVGKEDSKIGLGNNYIDLVGCLKFLDSMNSLAWFKKKGSFFLFSLLFFLENDPKPLS